MAKGICYGVSVGPGDPELITVKALNALKNADVIYLPRFPKEDCTAFNIVKGIYPEIEDKDIRYEATAAPMKHNMDTARHEEMAESVMKILDSGKNVAFPILGETCLYSTYFYIHEKIVPKGYESVLVNGIMALQAIAATLGISLCQGKEQLHVYPNGDDMKEWLNTPGTRVFMKPLNNLEETVALIKEHIASHPGQTAQGISSCGMPEEIIAKNVDELQNLRGYFTTIIVRDKQ